MQHDISDISFSLIKMTFKLRGLINQEFNFIDKFKKKKNSEILKQLTFSDSFQSRD
jgi:hypothetical protein